MTHGNVVGEALVNPFERVEAVCSSFRRGWKQGQPRRIEELLLEFEASGQAHLFRNLLHIEIEARRRRRDQPNSDEYIRRFPQYARVIRQAFFESTMMSLDELQGAAGHGTPAAEDVTISIAPAANRLGDYLLLRELGRGGFGVVFEARHVQRQNRVALKTLPLGDPQQAQWDVERLHKFRREFRALAEINHPNLIGMQSLEVDGRQWFFTMDLLDGTDFLSYVRPEGELDETRLRAALPQLASGIMALHGQRIAHRDLKPGNVMVTRDGRVVILDFGLVVELSQRVLDVTASLHSNHFAGTVAYAAPEQLAGGQLAASDWYSFGVMLYEALVGDRPFLGTATEIIAQKQRDDPPPLTGRADVPADLARLADGLLTRDSQIRPDALAIARALSVEVESRGHDSVDSASVRSSGGAGLILIGRETQLARLEQAHHQVLETKRAAAVFISGRSGEGKTSLAEKFLRPLREGPEMLVLAGRCYDRESVPFKAVDSIIDALVAFLRSRHDSVVKELLPRDIQMLAQLFPLLRRVDTIATLPASDISGLDSKQIRDRAFGALKQLLLAIGQRWPIVLFIDDLQWGDANSTAVLVRLLSPPDPPPLLFLGCFRSDEAEDSPFMQEWGKLRAGASAELFHPNVLVGPLSQEQCVSLVIARTGQDSQAIRERAMDLHRSTGGNPYFLDQLIDCFDPESGSFNPAPLKDVIGTRLQRLPAGAAPLLDVIAVSGQALSVDEALLASGQSEVVFATIKRMHNERLVRLIGSVERQLVDTYHDKIRETVLEQMDAAEQQRLHGQLGMVIERQEQLDGELLCSQIEQEQAIGVPGQKMPVRVFDLADHFVAAGDSRRALAYGLLAAEQAKSQFALDVALKNFAIAQRNAATASRGTQYRLALGYGETLVLAGRFEQAIRILEEANAWAETELERARIEAIQSEIAYKGGSITQSIDIAERAMRRVDVAVPSTNFGLLRAIAGQTLRHLSHQLVPQNWRARKGRKDAGRLLRFRLIYWINHPYHFRSTRHQFWGSILLLNEAELDGSPATAVGYVLHGAQLANSLGWYSRAHRFFQRTYEIARTTDNTSLEATSLRYLGYSQLAGGRFDEAAHSFETTAKLFETKVPDFWQRVMSRVWLSTAYHHLGRLAESAELARESFAAAVQAGQDRVAQMAIDPWARATGGELPFEELRSCIRPAPDDFTTTIQLLIAETCWHLHHQRAIEAIQSAEKAVGIIRHNWVFNLWTISAISLFARSLREHAESLEPTRHRDRRVYWDRSLRIARWAVRGGRFLGIDYATALRELSLSLAGLGRIRTALRYARKSCSVALRQNAKYEYALALQACGRLGERLGRPGSAQEIEQAQLLLDQFRALRQKAMAATWSKGGT